MPELFQLPRNYSAFQSKIVVSLRDEIDEYDNLLQTVPSFLQLETNALTVSVLKAMFCSVFDNVGYAIMCNAMMNAAKLRFFATTADSHTIR